MPKAGSRGNKMKWRWEVAVDVDTRKDRKMWTFARGNEMKLGSNLKPQMQAHMHINYLVGSDFLLRAYIG